MWDTVTVSLGKGEFMWQSGDGWWECGLSNAVGGFGCQWDACIRCGIYQRLRLAFGQRNKNSGNNDFEC